MTKKVKIRQHGKAGKKKSREVTAKKLVRTEGNITTLKRWL